MEGEDIRKRQLFGKLVRILTDGGNEVHIIIEKDSINEQTLAFLKELETRFGNKDIILTIGELIRGISKLKRE